LAETPSAPRERKTTRVAVRLLLQSAVIPHTPPRRRHWDQGPIDRITRPHVYYQRHNTLEPRS